jgi:hypothetical protein
MSRVFFLCVAIALHAGLLVAGDIRLENPVVVERLKLRLASHTALIHVRGGSACTDEEGKASPLKLPLRSTRAEVLYSLILAAHLGERQLAIWFDARRDCEIVQGHILD